MADEQEFSVILSKADKITEEMIELMIELYPICRSITGNGVRKTLKILSKVCPKILIKEVPSGMKVFDWIVPEEWNVKEAWIKGPDDKKISFFVLPGIINSP